MTRSSDFTGELSRLFWAVRDGQCSSEDLATLEELARKDEEIRESYIRFTVMCGALRYFAHRRALSAWRTTLRFRRPAPLASSGFLAGTIHGAIGYLSSGWPVAYLVATAVVGVGLLIGSLVPVSQPAQVARQSSVPSRVDAEPKAELVGWITGMVDCKWEGKRGQSPFVRSTRRAVPAKGDCPLFPLSPWATNSPWPPA